MSPSRTARTSVMRRFRASTAAPEDGWALVLVIAGMFVLSIFAAYVLDNGQASIKNGKNDQNYQEALSAAEAGVDAYVSSMNANAVTATWLANNMSGTGKTVSSEETYDYKVLSSADQVVNLGKSLVLQVTGHAGKRTRVVNATIGLSGYLNYVYYTQFETPDPVTYAANPKPSDCAHHLYDSTTRGADCNKIDFVSGDTLNGAVHSDDEIQISGNPTFNGSFDSNWPDPSTKDPATATVCWVDDSGNGSSKPNFSQTPQCPGHPAGFKPAVYPNAPTNLKIYAQQSGCVFTGPTRLLFNANGTITVTSPFTVGSAGTNCGTYTPGASAAGYTQTISVPNNQMIYVQKVGAGGIPAGATCTGPASLTTQLGFPIANDNSYTSSSTSLAYNCLNGDVFTEGFVSGRVTVATDNNIILTNNLRYAGKNGSAASTSVPTSSVAPNAADTSADDALGLAATGFVEVYHPENCTTTNNGDCVEDSTKAPNATPNATDVATTPYPVTNFEVDAAIIAYNNSFLVQNYNEGSRLGTLTVLGAIIQTFRGTVGARRTVNKQSVQTGFTKNYWYDTRFRTAVPPYLNTLANSVWSTQTYTEGSR